MPQTLTEEEFMALGQTAPPTGRLSESEFMSLSVRPPSMNAVTEEQSLQQSNELGSLTAPVPGAAPAFDPITPEEPRQSLSERMEEKKANRRTQLAEILVSQAKGEQGFGQTMIQMVGKVGVGTVYDYLGEVFSQGGRAVSALTPDVIEDPVRHGVANVALGVLNTDAGQAGLRAALGGVEMYEGFKEQHPVTARSLEAYVNIGMLLSPAKQRPRSLSFADDMLSNPVRALHDSVNPIRGALNTAQRVTSGAGRAASRQIARNRKQFIDDILIPLRGSNKKEGIIAGFGREVAGTFRRQKRTPLTLRDVRMREAVSSVKGVRHNNLHQQNINALIDERALIDIRLKRSLRNLPDTGSFATRREVISRLDSVRDGLLVSDDVIGGRGPRGYIERFTRIAKEKLADQKDSSPNSWLLARQEFDKAVKANINLNAKGGDLRSAKEAAWKGLRDEMNNLVHEHGGATSRRLLDRSSLMRNAIDILQDKAALEKDNLLVRMWHQASKILPFRSQANNIAAAGLGLGGLGAAATIAPFFSAGAAAGGATYYGFKALNSAQMKKLVGKMLGSIPQEAIRLSRGDQVLVRQLVESRNLLEQLTQAERDDLETD